MNALSPTQSKSRTLSKKATLSVSQGKNDKQIIQKILFFSHQDLLWSSLLMKCCAQSLWLLRIHAYSSSPLCEVHIIELNQNQQRLQLSSEENISHFSKKQLFQLVHLGIKLLSILQSILQLSDLGWCNKKLITICLRIIKTLFYWCIFQPSSSTHLSYSWLHLISCCQTLADTRHQCFQLAASSYWDALYLGIPDHCSLLQIFKTQLLQVAYPYIPIYYSTPGS